MWGLFSKKITKAAVWTSFATGIVGTVTHMCIFSFFSSSFPGLVKAAVSCPLNLASPINAGAILMLLSIIIVPVVSAFTKPCDQKAVDAVFACYDEKNA